MFLGRTPSFTQKAVDWTSERSASRSALQIPIKGAQGPERKPRRGVLFIVRPAHFLVFFCFSAARREAYRMIQQLSCRAAEKQKKGVLSAISINRTPLRGLRWLSGGYSGEMRIRLIPEKRGRSR